MQSHDGTAWWVYVGIAFFVVGALSMIILIYSKLQPKKKSASGEDENSNGYGPREIGQKVWGFLKNPVFFIAIGIAMTNWLVWALNGDFWNSLWSNQSTFWALNLTGWIAPCLLLIKETETKNTHPIAKAFAKILGECFGNR